MRVYSLAGLVGGSDKHASLQYIFIIYHRRKSYTASFLTQFQLNIISFSVNLAILLLQIFFPVVLNDLAYLKNWNLTFLPFLSIKQQRANFFIQFFPDLKRHQSGKTFLSNLHFLSYRLDCHTFLSQSNIFKQGKLCSSKRMYLNLNANIIHGTMS